MENNQQIITNYSNCTPAPDRVVVYIHTVPLPKSRGLIVTDESRIGHATRTEGGILVAIGSECFKNWANPPKIGDVVTFLSHVGVNRSSISPVPDDAGNPYDIFFKILYDKEIYAIFDENLNRNNK